MRVPLLQLFLNFCMFSLMAVGGANALIPEMQRQVVGLHHWMSNSEFVSLFAIAQAAPGPNMLIVSLIGWKLGGIAGATVSTVAMCGPSSVIAFGVARLWTRFQRSPWRRAIERGLAPLTIGLVLASGYLLTRAADDSYLALGVTCAAAIIAVRTQLNPLWLLAGGALAGVAGLV